MNDFAHAQIIEHSQLINRGIKPCSVLPVNPLNADQALIIAKSEGCYAFIRETEDENWCNIFIYKHSEMRFIIDALPDKPETKIDHFLLGFAFGYSIESILDYINKL